jgi:hypothetical protein
MFTQPRNWSQALRAYSAAGDGNGGGGGAGGGGGEQPQRRSSADVLQQYGNDAIRMADRVAELERDNYQLREQRRTLREEVTGLKGRQTPEGAVVLTGDDAKAWQAFSSLGKPDEVQAKLTERDTLAAEVAAAKKAETLRQVAEASGLNFAPLKRVGADHEYELRDATDADGKAVKVAYIKVGDAFKPLAEHVDTEWADIKPALTATGGSGNGNGGTQGGGIAFPAQRGGHGQPQTNAQVAGSYMSSVYKGPPKRT